MATPDTLDFERLLTPISEGSPTGPELREDASVSGMYYEVKDAREAARGAERQIQMAFGDEEQMADLELPNWGHVVDLAERVLAEESKDLWIAAWLIEGLARVHSFAGLRDGFRLIREISEQFWEEIHPEPDEDEGYASTVAQLTGLNGEDGDGALIVPIKAIPITDEGTLRALSCIDHRQATDFAQIADPEVREQRLAQGAISSEIFDRAVEESSPQFFANLIEDLEQCIDEFGKMVDVLDEKCGKDEWGDQLSPPSSNIKNTLQECLDLLQSVSRNKLALLETETSDDAGEEGAGDSADAGGMIAVEGGQSLATKKLQTREEAFDALLRVSDFFRRTEPHSVVSYALDQVVRWGRLALPDLLKELIGDEHARSEMFRRVGITETEESSEDDY